MAAWLSSRCSRLRGGVLAWSVLALGSAGAGCGAPEEGPAGPRDGGVPRIDGGPPAPDAPAGVVTYREHVAPIVFEHCVRCHTPGAIAPFPLDDWTNAARNAARMALATRERRMPPYYADDSGACRTHRDANWLDEAEIAALEAWAADPLHPEGDRSIPLPAPTLPPALARVDATIDLGMDYTPTGDDGAGDLDELRCFLVDPGTATDAFVTGYQVVPGAPTVVHHVIVYEPTEDPTAAAATLEAEDARPGWRCDGGARVPSYPVVLWAPGVGATRFPAGTGLRVVGGRPVVLQIHYNVAGGSRPDRTRVELQLAASVPAPAILIAVADPALALAPRMAEVSTSNDIAVPADGFVWGVLPHMHQRGLGMSVAVTGTPTGDECLLETVHWDFLWQQAYFYADPVEVRRGGRVSITCRYDTMGDDGIIRWGEQTTDEMCLSYVYATGTRP